MLSLKLLLVVIASAAPVLLGYATLLANRKSRTNRTFFLLSCLISAYTAVNYLADTDADRALLWVRAAFIIAAVTLHLTIVFVASFPRPVLSTKYFALLGVITASVMILSATPAIAPRVIRADDISNVVAGPLYPVYLTYVGMMLVLAAILIIRAYRLSRGIERARAAYMMSGFGFTAVFLAATNLIIPTLTGNNSISTFGVIGPLFFMAIMSIAILRHRLFNVRLVVARSITFTILLAVVGVIYTAVLLGISGAVLKSERGFGWDSVVEIALTLVIAFSFQGLRRFVERVTNGIFYRDHYDSQEVLNNFSKILVSELDLDRILKRSLQTLTDSVHIQYAQLVVFNHDRVYRIDHVGPVPRRLMIAPELAKLNHPMIIADELEGGERKALLEEHGIRVSLTLRTTEEFVGYLLLGDKLSGDIYSTQDIKLLEIIGKELAVAVLNAKAYAEIQAFNLTLQARVDHATNRLRVANRHLKELDHAKDEFISMASHQLRTPLTTIKGYLSMLQEGDAGKLSAAQKDFVDYAFGSSERMVNLISDLLNVSRLSAGRFLIQSKPTDVVQMVADEVRQLQTHATAKNINLVFQKPDSTFPLVELDDNKTRQVVMNFIDNAIYYTQEGEVRVVLELADKDHVRLEVRDTGIGVPRAAQRKLFSKFFRAENAQIVRPDGTGLGLYLAKRVVEDQGGTIIFSSVEGKGSTFGFELPLKPPPPPVITGKGHHAHHESPTV